jgi:energy-coupling factor transporter ATP-binding protein EcfA2
MSDYSTDISRYAANVDADAVKAIVDYCGIALQRRDSALVATSDDKELARVRDAFAMRKLGLTPEAADAGIKAVAEKMKGERNKSRVTFYYLLAEATNTLGKLTRAPQRPAAASPAPAQSPGV